jgi:hypothetical protein
VQWRLVEEWRVGGQATGPHSFDFNLGLARLPNGGFVHYDYKAHTLHYLDPQGRALRSVGREGNGPGEFGTVNGLVASPDARVIVSDLANGFVVFSDSGEFVGVVKPDFNRASLGQRWDAFVFDDGRLAENMKRPPGQMGGEFLRVVWSPDLVRADTVPASSCRVANSDRAATIALKDAEGKVMVNAPLMYVVPEQASAFDPGGAIWEQHDPARAEIVRHNLLDCRSTATIKLAGARARLSAESQANMIEMANAEAKRWRAVPPDQEDFPTEHAWYQSLYMDSERNVWVQRVDGEGNIRVEIFTADGAAVAEITGNSLPVAPIITATHVYGLVHDGDGVRYMVSLRIDR